MSAKQGLLIDDPMTYSVIWLMFKHGVTHHYLNTHGRALDIISNPMISLVKIVCKHTYFTFLIAFHQQGGIKSKYLTKTSLTIHNEQTKVES